MSFSSSSLASLRQQVLVRPAVVACTTTSTFRLTSQCTTFARSISATTTTTVSSQVRTPHIQYQHNIRRMTPSYVAYNRAASSLSNTHSSWKYSLLGKDGLNTRPLSTKSSDDSSKESTNTTTPSSSSSSPSSTSSAPAPSTTPANTTTPSPSPSSPPPTVVNVEGSHYSPVPNSAVRNILWPILSTSFSVFTELVSMASQIVVKVTVLCWDVAIIILTPTWKLVKVLYEPFSPTVNKMWDLFESKVPKVKEYREKVQEKWPEWRDWLKKEIHHYYVGTKLLVADTRIAANLIQDVLNGHELTRRERKQLLRTSADLLRFIPFAVIVVVPFAELALPILLKLFPNMLPSTYLDASGQEAKLQKQLLVKMEMTRFLQDTTSLLAGQLTKKSNVSPGVKNQAESFKQFMERVKAGQRVENSEIIQFTSLFDAELTLDSLNREQLKAMCSILDIRAFGSDWVLRYKLKEKLSKIQEDDELIASEGINSLSLEELQEACRARGIHPGKSLVYMRRKLKDWLELSLKSEVPISLLVLSRAFSRAMTYDPQKELAATLAHVSDEVVEEAEKSLVDHSNDMEAKLELLKKEEANVASNQPKKSVRVLPPVVSATETFVEVKEEHEDIKEDLHEVKATTSSAASSPINTGSTSTETQPTSHTHPHGTEGHSNRSDSEHDPSTAHLAAGSAPAFLHHHSTANLSLHQASAEVLPAAAAAVKAAAHAVQMASGTAKPDPKVMKVVDTLHERIAKLIEDMAHEIDKVHTHEEPPKTTNSNTSKSTVTNTPAASSSSSTTTTSTKKES